MTFGLGSKLHAFAHSIGQTSDEAEVRKLYSDVERLFSDHQLLFADGRSKLVRVIAARVLETHKLPADHHQFGFVATLLSDIMEYEELFQLPAIENRTRSTAEWWTLRDALARQAKLFDDFDATCDALRILLAQLYGELWEACSALLSSGAIEGVTVPSELSHILGKAGELVRSGSEAVFSKRLTDQSLLSNLQGTLEYNLIIASGGNPANVKAFTRTPKHADKSDISDPKALVDAYWGGTPLASLFDQKVQFTIPTSARFEHHHIVAGSGHGKTQTLQYLIASDIEKVISGNQSVVVIDSQGDLIRNISNMAVFAPDGPLHNRIVIIDPTDVEYPVSLNLFDVGQDRLEGYGLLERERLTNSILELYDFVLGTLLDAGMTQKQSVIFRYVTRLMLHIPDATIHTLRELMEPNAEVKFASDIAKLSGTAKHFFETEFSSREFEQTKKQVLRRLWGILENQTFERMFSHPKSKLDLFCEMNAGTRPPQQFQTIDARYKHIIYGLTNAAEQALKDADMWSDWVHKAGGPFWHQREVAKVTAGVEIDCLSRDDRNYIQGWHVLERAQTKLRYPVTFKDPSTGKTLTRDLIPDQLYGIEYLTDDGPRYRFHVVEVERGTNPKTSKQDRKSVERMEAMYEAGIEALKERLELRAPLLLNKTTSL